MDHNDADGGTGADALFVVRASTAVHTSRRYLTQMSAVL